MSNKSELEMQGVCGCPCHDPHGVVAQCSCYHGDFREFREELKVAEDMAVDAIAMLRGTQLDRDRWRALADELGTWIENIRKMEGVGNTPATRLSMQSLLKIGDRLVAQWKAMGRDEK